MFAQIHAVGATCVSLERLTYETSVVGLNAGIDCQRLFYLILDTFTDTFGTRTIIPVTITTVMAGKLVGKFTAPLPAQEGDYTVKVFIGDKASTSPDKLSIK